MKKIYIVDDDRDMVDSLSIVLRSVGYEVGAQYDDKNIVENLLKFGANLVILDVMFPENDLSGFELARDIRNCDKTRGVAILMLSAVNETLMYSGRFSKKNNAGALSSVDDFVEKPVPPAELLKKVRQLLGE